jgi:outer membrane receptor protein involved in Fe transport
MVTASGDTPLVETTRTAFTNTVDARSVASLPLNGRNFLNLVLLTPGAAASGGNNGFFFSVAGQSSMNSLVVDGVDQNGFMTAPIGSAQLNRYLFSQEAIQEFQVNTASYSAEFGRAGTAVVSVVTKSGTNFWRGSTFWYYRDQAMNATDAFRKARGNSKDPFHANQFGATLGGPIRRDQVFFYASYDGQRRKRLSSTELNLPSGFTVSANPTVAGFQRRALEYLEARAVPYTVAFDQNVILGKLDWQPARDHVVRTSWNRHRLAFANGAQAAADSLEHNGNSGQIADTLAVSVTSVLNSRALNVARFAYVANHDPATPNGSSPEAIVVEGGLTVLTVGRSPILPNDNGVWRGEWSDTLSLTRGQHALKVGSSLMVERARYFSGLNFSGTYRFTSLERFGRSLEGAPGMAASYRQAFCAVGAPSIDVHPNDLYIAGFVQDTWRVHPALTLDVGLRYDVQVMERSRVRNDAPALTALGVDTTFIPTDRDNFAPRFGVAWAPARSQRFVIRAGYGLYFPRFLPAAAARAFFQNGVTVQTRSFTGTSIPAYPNTMCGPPNPSGAPPACPTPTGAGADMIMAIPRGFQQSAIQQASAGVEHQLARDLAVAVSYLRVRGDHLYHWQDINLSQPSAASIGIADTDTVLTYRKYDSQNRPSRQFDRIFLLNSNGHSSYHGFVVQARKRFSGRYQLNASYTLSRTIDDNPTSGVLNPGPADADLLSDSLDPSLDRGEADYSVRHRFVASGIWALDYASGLNGAAKAILAGWELSGSAVSESGGFYSGYLNSDLNGDGNATTDRAPEVERNTFVKPATYWLDVRLTRTLVVRHATLQLSLDAFNAFNRPNIGGVVTTQYVVSTDASKCGIAGTPCLVAQNSGDKAFGAPSGATDARVLQLSARLSF